MHQLLFVTIILSTDFECTIPTSHTLNSHLGSTLFIKHHGKLNYMTSRFRTGLFSIPNNVHVGTENDDKSSKQ